LKSIKTKLQLQKFVFIECIYSQKMPETAMKNVKAEANFDSKRLKKSYILLFIALFNFSL